MSSYQDNIDLEMELVAIQMATDKILAISDGIEKLSTLKWEDKSEGEKKFLSFLSNRVFTTETDLVDGNEAIYVNLNKVADMAKAAWPAIKKAGMAIYKFIKDTLAKIWAWITGLFGGKKDSSSATSIAELNDLIDRIDSGLKRLINHVKTMIGQLESPRYEIKDNKQHLDVLEMYSNKLERYQMSIKLISASFMSLSERYKEAADRQKLKNFKLDAEETRKLAEVRQKVVDFLNSADVYDLSKSFFSRPENASEDIHNALLAAAACVSKSMVDSTEALYSGLAADISVFESTRAASFIRLSPAERIKDLRALMNGPKVLEVKSISVNNLRESKAVLAGLLREFAAVADRIPSEKMIDMISDVRVNLERREGYTLDRFNNTPLSKTIERYENASPKSGHDGIIYQGQMFKTGAVYAIQISSKFPTFQLNLGNDYTMFGVEHGQNVESVMESIEPEIVELLSAIQVFIKEGREGLDKANDAFKNYIDALERHELTDMTTPAAWMKIIKDDPKFDPDNARYKLMQLTNQSEYAKMIHIFTKEYVKVARMAKELKLILDAGWPL